MFLPNFCTKIKKKLNQPGELFYTKNFLKKVTLVSCNSFFILVLKIRWNSLKKYNYLSSKVWGFKKVKKWKYAIFGLTQCYCYTGDLPPSPWIIQTLLVANLRDPPFYGTAIKLRLTCVETRTSFSSAQHQALTSETDNWQFILKW